MSITETLLAGIFICLFIIISKLDKIFRKLDNDSTLDTEEGYTVKVKDYLPRFNEDLGKISRACEEILENSKIKK